MKDEKRTELAASELPEIVRKIRARTPARLLAGRAGAAYRTGTQLELREAHAAARDAVRDELRCQEMLGSAFLEKWNLFEVSTKATAKDEYLLRPELGRHFNERALAELQKRCSIGNDLQIAIGDGLSVSAVTAQVPALLPLLSEGARQRQWTVGQVFVIHHCRVGILNEIGELLRPRVAVLLIGERPGLATAESLSAYMAYEPRRSHTDAERNVISNIHARGLATEQAVERILKLAEEIMRTRVSGCRLKEGGAALRIE
jgi:ethanolamine ammonia-lyase small subunit